MALYRDEGVVLRTFRLGEVDRIIVFATPEHGKVRAVAKGVRRTKSRIGGRVEPLNHLDLQFWRGRDLDIVTQAQLLDQFRPVRAELERTTAAMSIVEVVEHVALEAHPMPELFRMLVGALAALGTNHPPLVSGAFCWKMLALEGIGPVTEHCARCGDDAPLVAFDAGQGGFLCHGCRRGVAVSSEAVALVRRILGGGLAGVLAEAPSPAADEVEHLARTAVEHHIDRRLRAPQHLPDIGRRGA